MGCAASAAPDGDGVSTLTWLPNDSEKLEARRHIQEHLYFGFSNSKRWWLRILVNQAVIWRKLSLDQVNTVEELFLPYPADDIVKVVAEETKDLYGRCSRILVNQEAAWRKLCGEQVDMIPYTATDEQRHLHTTNVEFDYHRLCSILVNQETIWRKLCGEQVDALPHPATDQCRIDAGRTDLKQISLESRIWVNDDAIFNKLSLVRVRELQIL